MWPPRASRIAALLSLGFALLGCPPTCRSEWLYFADGGQFQAPIRRSDGRVWVHTPAGRYSFADRDFRAIVPGGCPDRDWPSRREAAGSSADRQFAAAWWALENGLIPECVSMLRSAHAAHPAHQPTARLVKTLDRLERPRPDPDVDPLCRALVVSCEVERGPQIYLIHQHEPDDARARVELLERVTTAYYLVLAAHGLDLAVPSRRLVSVYLRDRHDYLAFLESQNANAFRKTLGYYHPIFRATITYDPRPVGPRKTPGDGPSSELRQSSSPVAKSEIVPPAGAERRRLLADLETAALSDGTAAHELVHLLVSESGLASDPGVFPLWLHEGFASQFEVVRGGRWAGVGRVHDLRLPDYRAATPPALLETMIRDTGFGHGYRRDLYANCWALVYFLGKTRPREFSAFLDLLRSPARGSDGDEAARFDSTFRSAFGNDLGPLETEWHAFMSNLLTPLEEHDPAGLAVARRVR